jgi:hypothetical protein
LARDPKLQEALSTLKITGPYCALLALGFDGVPSVSSVQIVPSVFKLKEILYTV